jgi:uncharacterized protein with GYD domain
MIFITLWNFRQKATKEMLAVSVKLAEQLPAEGINIVSNYWTLGRYDLIMESGVLSMGKARTQYCPTRSLVDSS